MPALRRDLVPSTGSSPPLTADQLYDMVLGPATTTTEKRFKVEAFQTMIQHYEKGSTFPARDIGYKPLSATGAVFRKAASQFWGSWSAFERWFWMIYGEPNLHINKCKNISALPLVRVGYRSAVDMPCMVIRMVLRRAMGSNTEILGWYKQMTRADRAFLNGIKPFSESEWNSACRMDGCRQGDQTPTSFSPATLFSSSERGSSSSDNKTRPGEQIYIQTRAGECPLCTLLTLLAKTRKHRHSLRPWNSPRGVTQACLLLKGGKSGVTGEKPHHAVTVRL